jgi:hypothetical protein
MCMELCEAMRVPPRKSPATTRYAAMCLRDARQDASRAPQSWHGELARGTSGKRQGTPIAQSRSMIVRLTLAGAVTALAFVLCPAVLVGSACDSSRSTAPLVASPESQPALDPNITDGSPVDAPKPRDAYPTTPAPPATEEDEKEPPLGLPPKQVPPGEHPGHRVPSPEKTIPEKVPPGEGPR